MSGAGWLDELRDLLVRCSDLGIGSDVAAMSLTELWGLYCLLRRLAEA